MGMENGNAERRMENQKGANADKRMKKDPNAQRRRGRRGQHWKRSFSSRENCER